MTESKKYTVKELRRHWGFSQAKLGKIIGRAQRTISSIECKKKSLTRRNALALVKYARLNGFPDLTSDDLLD